MHYSILCYIILQIFFKNWIDYFWLLNFFIKTDNCSMQLRLEKVYIRAKKKLNFLLKLCPWIEVWFQIVKCLAEPNITNHLSKNIAFNWTILNFSNFIWFTAFHIRLYSFNAIYSLRRTSTKIHWNTRTQLTQKFFEDAFLDTFSYKIFQISYWLNWKCTFDIDKSHYFAL